MSKDIYLNYRSKMIPVTISEISMVVASRAYCRIVTTKKHFLIQSTIKKMEKRLIPYGFLRVHRKFIISLSHITQIQGKWIKIGDMKIPIGKTYHKDFLDKLNIIK